MGENVTEKISGVFQGFLHKRNKNLRTVISFILGMYAAEAAIANGRCWLINRQLANWNAPCAGDGTVKLLVPEK